jgi:YVTN family beta-propeller protein
MRQSIVVRPITSAGSKAGLLLLLLCGCAGYHNPSSLPLVRKDQVGVVAADRFVTPTGQVLTPVGRQVSLPRMRPQALALSPDGRLLATSGSKDAIALIDPVSGAVLQSVPLTLITRPAIAQSYGAAGQSRTNSTATKTNAVSSKPITNSAQLSFTGLVFSPDGRRLYLSNTGGNIWMFVVNDGRIAWPPVMLPVPDAEAPKRTKEIPTGLAVSADSKRLYVAGNLGGRLYELDALTGRPVRDWETGVAPYDVVLIGSKAYVSNLGGRFPQSGEPTAPAGKGTTILVDPLHDLPLAGSVTVIDLASGKIVSQFTTGHHTSALAASPDGKYVVAANTGDDTLTVIDTHTDQVVEKIWARQTPADLFGAQPNALAFAPDGHRLYVCNGTQNAVAVIGFDPQQNASQVVGLIPAGWFPGAIQFDARRRAIYVANIKGIGVARNLRPGEWPKLNSKDFYGTVSLMRVPDERQLAAFTRVALRNMQYPRLAEALLPPRPDQPPRPVPERAGEPSPLKHVIYVIKENRSYDQILGDMPEGNGDPSLCVFGEKYTPNQHKLSREFILLDNTYCSGARSADGHQWTDSAMANEYVERQITCDTPRSYPGAKEVDSVDALAWASSGFIWDNALAHGKTFRNYGEWMLTRCGWSDPKHKGGITWRDYWQDFQTGLCATKIQSKAGIASLRPYSNTNTVGWDLKVPDVVRAAEFIRELRQFEAKGELPQLMIIFLPNDHVGGARSDYPTPGSQVADNDLALGRIVEAITHSRFWPETCLFAIEDDPQAGWDHVSGYRTTCFVVSPYTKRNQTIHTQYNQCSLVRTIEQILGLPPMNQLDAAATPMADCFTVAPDFTPFDSVPNKVPLDRINPDAKQIADKILRRDAIISNRLPLDQPDRCPEDLLNRIVWRAMKGHEPYPEWAVKSVGDLD